VGFEMRHRMMLLHGVVLASLTDRHRGFYANRAVDGSEEAC